MGSDQNAAKLRLILSLFLYSSIYFVEEPERRSEAVGKFSRRDYDIATTGVSLIISNNELKNP